MPDIEARGLIKVYRSAVKPPGLAGALRHVLRPRYQQKTAVDALDLGIEAGESVACIGPNGAGKSTLVKLLTGVLVPTAGEVRVRDLTPHLQRVANARNIAVVFGQRSQLWWDLPVRESLRILGDIYEVPAPAFRRNLLELTELLQLTPLLPIPARQLSLGQRMRCDLCATLLHGPAILYLDEPTIGLDVAVKERMRQFLKRINRERGVTIFLTSHDIADIEDVCRRVLMIDQGKLVYDGDFATLRGRFARGRVIRLVLRESLDGAAARAVAVLAGLPVARVEQEDSYRLAVEFDMTRVTAAEVAGRLLPVLPVKDFQIDEPSTESVIRRLYEGELALDEAGMPEPEEA